MATLTVSRPPSSTIVEEGNGKMTDQSARTTPSLQEEEDPVKRALMKKRQFITAEVQLNLADATEMVHQNIISPEMLQQFKSAEGPSERVNLLLDFALLDMTKEQLDAFLENLRKRMGDDYDDIEAEIIMESGLFIVEDSVRMDASMAVHRCFGSSKRFSEGDKRNVTDVLASKMQMTKLLWKARMSKMAEENEKMKNTSSQWNTAVNNINKEIERFLRRNEFAIFDFSDMKSTTQVLMKDSDENKMVKLAEKTSYVLHKFGQSIMEKETYAKDREKCFNLLKVKTKDPLQTVSNFLQKYMKENDKKISHLKKDVKSLEKRIKEMEEELSTKESDMEAMAEKVEKQRIELVSLRERVKSLCDEELILEGSKDIPDLPSGVMPKSIRLEKPHRALSSKSLPAKSAVKNKTRGLKTGMVF